MSKGGGEGGIKNKRGGRGGGGGGEGPHHTLPMHWDLNPSPVMQYGIAYLRQTRS